MSFPSPAPPLMANIHYGSLTMSVPCTAPPLMANIHDGSLTMSIPGPAPPLMAKTIPSAMHPGSDGVVGCCCCRGEEAGPLPFRAAASATRAARRTSLESVKGVGSVLGVSLGESREYGHSGSQM